MTESSNNIFLNHTESEIDQDIPLKPIINNNNNNLSSYLFKNGNKIVLSGKNLQNNEYQNILHQLISSHPSATEVDLSNCNLEIFPEELLTLKHLSSLDLRSNQFANFELLVQKLITINNLNDLKIDLIDQNQVLMILS